MSDSSTIILRSGTPLMVTNLFSSRNNGDNQFKTGYFHKVTINFWQKIYIYIITTTTTHNITSTYNSTQYYCTKYHIQVVTCIVSSTGLEARSTCQRQRLCPPPALAMDAGPAADPAAVRPGWPHPGADHVSAGADGARHWSETNTRDSAEIYQFNVLNFSVCILSHRIVIFWA